MGTDETLGHPDIDSFEAKATRRWDTLRKARGEATRTRATMDARFRKIDCANASFVVFGSLARDEFTDRSDVDWTLLVDGPADPTYIDVGLQIQDLVKELDLCEPGREEVFGVISNSHDLVNNIGGSDDSNRNITQRLLLLLESKAIGSDSARSTVIRKILRRYIDEDFGWTHQERRFHVPRFLLNDVVRYWRTMAVDFAYKRKTRAGEQWALRTAKLRFSRKLIYASGLVTCYAPHLAECGGDVVAMTEFLAHFVDMTPIERMIWLAETANQCEESVAVLLTVYEQFVDILDDPEQREALERLRREDAIRDPLFTKVRTLSRKFQDAVDKLFWNPPLEELTKTYGVF